MGRRRGPGRPGGESREPRTHHGKPGGAEKGYADRPCERRGMQGGRNVPAQRMVPELRQAPEINSRSELWPGA